MGCELKPPTGPPPASVTIYGDYLDQDTRALLAICKIADEPYEFVHIDTLKHEQTKEDFKALTKLRTGDEVIVVAGKDLGKKGTLRKIIKSKNKGIVTGINMVKKHTKPNPEMGVTGGVVEQEAAIALSNLAIWNPSKKSKDKISYSTNKDGKKIRLFKSDSKEIK